MDLYRINYAALVSKWVGESAKNTHALLRKAASMDCILLFDEADSMFARRTSEMKDAQDKFANTDASHLMVAIEAYGGIVILASNLKGHIDPAFVRRLRYIVDFPKPDADQRLELWNRLVASLAGANACARLQPELRQLAVDVDATGSQIKFGLVGALFAARRSRTDLALDHLLDGLNRELTKEGRGLSDRDRERIAAHAR
jgi:SpoVK/Ycf46/Vps4 family AAA+-type ATPase